MSKFLVAYFSATGTTAKAARLLSEPLGADLFEIVPAQPYTKKDLNWLNPKSRSTLEMKNPASRPEIAKLPENIADYAIIFIGFPIWWYVAPTIINTFLEGLDLSGKTIIPFATSGGSGMGKTNERLAPSCPNSKLLDGMLLNRANEKKVAQWLSSLGF